MATMAEITHMSSEHAHRRPRVPLRLAATISLGLGLTIGAAACSGDDTDTVVLSEPAAPFESIDELASVSHVVAALRIERPLELVPVGMVEEEGDEQTYAIQVYEATVEDVIANLGEYFPIEKGGTVRVGLEVANPEASTAESVSAEVAKYSTPMTGGEMTVGFMASLETVGLRDTLGFVRSDFGRFSIGSDGTLDYFGDGPIDENRLSLEELRAKVNDPATPFGSVILRSLEEGRAPTTAYVQPEGSVLPTIAPEE